jgi:hypothetical protein
LGPSVAPVVLFFLGSNVVKNSGSQIEIVPFLGEPHKDFAAPARELADASRSINKLAPSRAHRLMMSASEGVTDSALLAVEVSF